MAGTLQKARLAFTRLTGLHVFRHPPRGAVLHADIACYLPYIDITTIFDVGANRGQSAEAYLWQFPRARIHSFEPVGETFGLLQRRFEGNDRVRTYHTALGSAVGTASMSLEGPSEIFRIGGAGSVRETVRVDTLDSFCSANSISRINLLKVDTEGHDLEVLKGGARMLQSGQIDLVQVEAGMNPLNEHHVSFEELKAFLEAQGFLLFSVFEQMQRFVPPAPYMHWANPTFVSRQSIR